MGLDQVGGLYTRSRDDNRDTAIGVFINDFHN